MPNTTNTPPLTITTTIHLTPTIHLRPYRPSDIQSLARAANHAVIARGLRDRFPHPYTLRDAEAYVAQCLDEERWIPLSLGEGAKGSADRGREGEGARAESTTTAADPTRTSGVARLPCDYALVYEGPMEQGKEEQGGEEQEIAASPASNDSSSSSSPSTHPPRPPTTSRIIGSLSLTPGSDVYARTAEVGYWLHPTFWGQGIMTRAVRAVTGDDGGVATLGLWSALPWLERIWATQYAWNEGSAKVLAKAGFVREGCARRGAWKDGRVVDEVLWGMVRGEAWRGGDGKVG